MTAGAAIAVVTAGCGTGEDDSLEATRAQLGAGPDPNGILGLEVTSIGEITEVLDDNAFRMDKDGVTPGVSDDLTPPSPGDSPAGTDLDPLDPDSFINGDEELDDGTDQEKVLVLVPGADLELRAGDPVRITGTIRSLDAQAVEEVYGVEIDTDTYAPYLNQLVVIAESVSPVG